MKDGRKRIARKAVFLLIVAALLILTSCSRPADPAGTSGEPGTSASVTEGDTAGLTEPGTDSFTEPGTTVSAEPETTASAEPETTAPAEPGPDAPETPPETESAAPAPPETEAEDPEKESSYQTIRKQLDGKKYTAAITALRKLGDYKDSRELLLEAELAMLRETKAGDVILFGEGALNAGNKTPRPLSWTVLEKRRNKALVVSQNFPGPSMPYSTSGSCLWAESDVRAWLNGEYLASNFREEEQERIRKTYVPRGVNPYSGEIDEGPETTDRIFLLSLTEWEPFENLLNNVAFGSDPYWTRTPGRDGRVFCAHGFSQMASEEGAADNAYVRPVMWIDFGEEPEPDLAALPPYDTKTADMTDPGDVVRDLLLAQQENYPEGMPWVDSGDAGYTEEYEYDTMLLIRKADWENNNFSIGVEHFYAEACMAFARRMNDLVFGSMEVDGGSVVLEKESDAVLFFSRLQPGDIVGVYNAEGPGHAVVVLLATLGYLVVAEGNYNGTIHWGRVITAADMLDHVVAVFETRWPVFYIQPQDVRAASGEAVRFYATASEKPASCTWLISRDGGENWFELKGEEQDPVLEFRAASENDGWLFCCRLEYSTGLVLYSDPARLDVTP